MKEEKDKPTELACAISEYMYHISNYTISEVNTERKLYPFSKFPETFCYHLNERMGALNSQLAECYPDDPFNEEVKKRVGRIFQDLCNILDDIKADREAYMSEMPGYLKVRKDMDDLAQEICNHYPK